MTESFCSIGDGVTVTLDSIDGIDLVTEDIPRTQLVKFFTSDEHGLTVEITIPVDLGALGSDVTVTLPRKALVDHLNAWTVAHLAPLVPGQRVGLWLPDEHGQQRYVVGTVIELGYNDVYQVRIPDGVTRVARAGLQPLPEEC